MFPSHHQEEGGGPGPSQGLSLSLNSASQQDGFLLLGKYLGGGGGEGGGPSAGPGQEVRGSRYLGPAKELLNEFCSLGIIEMYSSSHHHHHHHDPPYGQKKNHPRLHKSNYNNREDYWANGGGSGGGDNTNINACGSPPPPPSSSRPSLTCPSLDFVALHKRKAKFLSMLDEVFFLL